MHRNGTSLLSSALLLGMSATANAFDTSHHSDLTREALIDLGFSNTAVEVSQVENWLVDYYSNREAGVEDSINAECDKLHADNRQLCTWQTLRRH